MRLMMIDVLQAMSSLWDQATSGQSTRERSLHVIEETKSFILGCIEDQNPTHVLVVWTSTDSSRRRSFNPLYDLDKHSLPLGFFPHLASFSRWLSEQGLVSTEVNGVEAYDIMSLLIEKLQGSEIVMVTPDPRCWSYVTERCSVVWPFQKGLHKEMTPTTFSAVMGEAAIEPAAYLDYLVLTSLRGIGPKQASGLVRKYGSLEAIAKDLDNVGGRSGKILQATLKTDGRTAYRDIHPIAITSALGIRLGDLAIGEELKAA